MENTQRRHPLENVIIGMAKANKMIDITTTSIELAAGMVRGRGGEAYRIVAADVLLCMTETGKLVRHGEWSNKNKPEEGGPYFTLADAIEGMSENSFKLQCDWESWEQIGPGELMLKMPEGNCCDMNGAIDIAQAIMPGVWRIATYAGGSPDTEYRKLKGVWVAFSQKTVARIAAEPLNIYDEERERVMDMSAQHIPGPWRVTALGDEFRVEEHVRTEAICEDEEGMPCVWSEYNIATARLIAAAPELLRALKNLFVCMLAQDLENHEVRPTEEVYMACMGAAYQAITKATGGQQQ